MNPLARVFFAPLGIAAIGLLMIFLDKGLKWKGKEEQYLGVLR